MERALDTERIMARFARIDAADYLDDDQTVAAYISAA